MKILQGVAQASGHWTTSLVDPEDLGLLRFEETGELPEGMDFAVLRDEVWREGRCYDSSHERTFVTYGDAERLSLRAGMQGRLPLYALGTERLLDLARTYVQELGYIPMQEGTTVGEYATIASGEDTNVGVLTGNDRLPVVIMIDLSSNGDVRLHADTETFPISRAESEEDTVG